MHMLEKVEHTHAVFLHEPVVNQMWRDVTEVFLPKIVDDIYLYVVVINNVCCVVGGSNMIRLRSYHMMLRGSVGTDHNFFGVSLAMFHMAAFSLATGKYH